jgi:hypothetical protein
MLVGIHHSIIRGSMRNIVVFARVISLCLLLCAPLAWSADVPVTSNLDSGTGTLRDALANANNGDTIVFELPLESTITLATTLTVTKTLAIDGAGSSGLTINGNHATNVLTINNTASATVSNLAIADGIVGIYSVGPLSVSKCTISGGVIGIESYSTLTVANSTIFGNSSPNFGGAIKIHSGFGTTTIANNTFVNNAAHYGGAIESESSSPGTVTNNIFQGSYATQFGGAICDASGKINADHNLYWNNPDLSGPGCYGCVTDGNAILADPLLGSLADNGGPTQTYAPALGSPAIDSADDVTCAAPAVNNLDQRGVVRPTGAHCDIGAVESNDRVFLDGFEPAI